MNRIEKADALLYRVLVNRDAEFSIWPTGREIPVGWMTIGITATRSECLAYIDKLWAPRPLGLRKRERETAH